LRLFLFSAKRKRYLRLLFLLILSILSEAFSNSAKASSKDFDMLSKASTVVDAGLELSPGWLEPSDD